MAMAILFFTLPLFQICKGIRIIQCNGNGKEQGMAMAILIFTLQLFQTCKDIRKPKEQWHWQYQGQWRWQQKSLPCHCFKLHARESKSRISFNTEHSCARIVLPKIIVCSDGDVEDHDEAGDLMI